MESGQIRRAILEDHRALRELLVEMDLLARRVLGGEGDLGAEIRAAGERFRERFLRHLDVEDAHLVPALRTVDAWGEERAARVAQEHREQRAQMDALLEDLRDARRDTPEIARELLELEEAILRDMEHEERAILDADLLRDDVVSVDVEAE